MFNRDNWIWFRFYLLLNRKEHKTETDIVTCFIFILSVVFFYFFFVWRCISIGRIAMDVPATYITQPYFCVYVPNDDFIESLRLWLYVFIFIRAQIPVHSQLNNNEWEFSRISYEGTGCSVCRRIDVRSLIVY